MSEDYVLDAQARDDLGKGASRRLRRLEGLVPGIVYGGSKNPVNISINHKDLVKHLENEAFYSHIISLNIAGKAEDVILKDLQRHPSKPRFCTPTSCACPSPPSCTPAYLCTSSTKPALKV